MAYIATTEQLVEECQQYLDYDPRFFDANEGAFTWWGKVVEFFKTADEITLNVDGQSVTFPRP